MFEFWAVYMIDEDGEPIEHTEQDHGQLTFLTKEECDEKVQICLDAGQSVLIEHIGPV